MDLWQFAQKVIAVVLIAAGGFLGYTAFDQTLQVYRDPGKIEQWLKVREQVHRPPVEEKKSLLNIDVQPSLLSDESLYILSGYAALALGIVVLMLMAHIAVAFLHGGVKILIADRSKKE